MHNHTDDGEPMFSGEDTISLLLYFNRNSNRPGGTLPNDVFSIMTTPQGNTYALGINDIFSFSVAINSRGFQRFVRKINKAIGRSSLNSSTDFERALLNILDKIIDPNNAVNLYRLNFDGTAFDKLTLDENGLIETTPCP